jgi:hypothetical protein
MLANCGGAGILGAMPVDSPPPPVLTVRPYTPDDYLMAARWHMNHGNELVDFVLPPLGAVVEDAKGPAVILWCAEPAGFGCAYLEFPLSRPGLSLAESMAAFKLAVQALMETAGQGYDPPGEYHSFRAVTPAPLARMLMRLGFYRETTEELTPMLYRRD